MSLLFNDFSGNLRRYRRRAADGFLCYDTPAGEVCEDFGDTLIIVVGDMVIL